MPRQRRNIKTRKTKPLIHVFCEGESEQAYTDFLKKTFSDVAVIKRPKAAGIFETADSIYKKEIRFRDEAEVTDEIWFFFDVEKKDVGKWDDRFKIIRRLRKLNRAGIRVRLLMTTACIEYWLMLHYKMYTPAIESVADKERIMGEVVSREPTYKKGDYDSTTRIAALYPTAVVNGEHTVKNLLEFGLPGLDDTDERNRWLYTKCLTFSTVYEAVNFLEGLAEDRHRNG